MRNCLIFAAINGVLAVLAGTFGAHVLPGRLSPQEMAWLDTAQRYQMWHALALALTAALAPGAGGRRWLGLAAWGFSLGLVLFCGALYTLALTGWRPVAMAAPLGGLGFMAGWVALGVHALGERGRA